MNTISQNIFFFFVGEVVSVVLAFIVKDEKKRIRILIIGTMLSGILAFGLQEGFDFSRFSVATISPTQTKIQVQNLSPAQIISQDINIEGTWSHLVDGKTNILRGYKDSSGNMHLDFIEQYYSYQPIFESYAINDNQVEVEFRMVLYSDPSNISGYTITYILFRQEGNMIYGQLNRNWDSPREIVLVKQN